MLTLVVAKNIINRGATATKASKARALPKFWVTVNPISTRGADYAHHSTMGLVWLKFAVAPLMSVKIGVVAMANLNSIHSLVPLS